MDVEMPVPGSSAAPAGSAEMDTGDCAQESCFDCNICMEVPTEPVITVCGHLFCWACLYKWTTMTADCPKCPVCSAGVDRERVIPIYGRGKKRGDPDPTARASPDGSGSTEVPERPAGLRPEPVQYGARVRASLLTTVALEPETLLFAVSIPIVLLQRFQPYAIHGSGANITAQIGGVSFSSGLGLFPSLFALTFVSFRSMKFEPFRDAFLGRV